MVDCGLQSATVRSYASAVKSVLKADGYPWDDQKVLLNTITKACKLVNDIVTIRLPISGGLLDMILFELERHFGSGKQPQPYLEIMYKTLFSLGYYGLLRVGELTTGSHPIKARDIHVGENKDKMLILLCSSKPMAKSHVHRGSK